MKLSELMDELYELELGDDDPDVYIRLGLNQVKVSGVEYFPETDDTYPAVVID